MSHNLEAESLLPNWDFSNKDFTYGSTWPQANYLQPGFTSDYQAMVPDQYGTLYSEAAYAIASNPSSMNPNFVSITDFSGSGNMLVVNGATGATALHDVVWTATVPTVTQNTDYFFEAYVININNPASWGGNLTGWKSSQAILEFQVWDNAASTWVGLGQQVDFTSAAVDSTQWNLISNVWNTGNNTSTTIRLVNLQTAADGNDFALDNLNFSTQTVVIPEPSSAFLLSLTGFWMILRRRKSN